MSSQPIQCNTKAIVLACLQILLDPCLFLFVKYLLQSTGFDSTHEIPEDQGMHSVFHIIQEPTTDIILEILKEPIKNEQDQQDPDFKMKTAYRQCVDLERLDKDGMNFVSAEKVFLSVTTEFNFAIIFSFCFPRFTFTSFR